MVETAEEQSQGLSSEDLWDAWVVLSSDDRKNGFLLLSREDQEEFFEGLTSRDQTALLLWLPPAKSGVR